MISIKGWTAAFEVELFSFLSLDVKVDVHEDTLDLRRVTILAGKAVMVKKPNGDELTRLKREWWCVETFNRFNLKKKHVPTLLPFRCCEFLSQRHLSMVGLWQVGMCQRRSYMFLCQKDRNVL